MTTVMINLNNGWTVTWNQPMSPVVRTQEDEGRINFSTVFIRQFVSGTNKDSLIIHEQFQGNFSPKHMNKSCWNTANVC